MKRIGFLFNHDAVHQVAHLAPILVFLRKLFPDVEVQALVTSQAQENRLVEITSNTSKLPFKISMTLAFSFDDWVRVIKTV